MVAKDLSLTKEFHEIQSLINEYSDLKKIVFTGNIGECQDFPSVLKAIKILKDRKDFVLLIVGSGREEKNVKRKIIEYDLNCCVKLLGRYPVEYMPAFYHFADALLLPLAKDPLFEITLPGKTQSYLFAGRPIIGMLDGEGASVLHQSNSAFVCRSGKPKELANQIERFCDASPEELAELGSSAKHYAKQNFSSERVMKKLFKVCNL